jgi:PTS system mannose-specific IIA component
MVGLVVAAHGRLAEEMVSTAAGIVGPLNGVATVSIEPGTPPEGIRDQVQRAVSSVDSGEGVLVLADLFGGTPCKECLMLCNQRQIEVLAGMNLPMLIKANSLRAGTMPLPDMAHTLAVYGQKTITCASDLIRDASETRRS